MKSRKINKIVFFLIIINIKRKDQIVPKMIVKPMKSCFESDFKKVKCYFAFISIIATNLQKKIKNTTITSINLKKC